MIDEKRKTTNAQYKLPLIVRSRYLKVIDKSNGYFVSAYLTPGNILQMSSVLSPKY